MALLVRHQLQMMARYNVWATTKLLSAVDALSDDEYYRDVGLFFKSVHGTLNHVVVAEHDVWYQRIHDGKSPRDVVLDGEVEPSREKLQRTLIDKAQRWAPLLDAMDDDAITGQFQYNSIMGDPHCLPFMAVMLHVFNHGTHHRGQVTAALTMLSKKSPSIDLVYMLHEEQQEA